MWHPASRGREKLKIGLMQWELVMQRVGILPPACLVHLTLLRQPMSFQEDHRTGSWFEGQCWHTYVALTFLREIKSSELERHRHIHSSFLKTWYSWVSTLPWWQFPDSEIVKQQVRATQREFRWLRRCPSHFVIKKKWGSPRKGKKNPPTYQSILGKTIQVHIYIRKLRSQEGKNGYMPYISRPLVHRKAQVVTSAFSLTHCPQKSVSSHKAQICFWLPD